MKQYIELLMKIFKTIYDFIRLIFYCIVLILKGAVFVTGAACIGIGIYSMYKAFIYFNVTKALSIPATIIAMIIILIPALIVMRILYYILNLIYILLCWVGLISYDDNEIINNIEVFFDQLLFKFSPKRRNEIANMLGFNSYEDFIKYTAKEDTEIK